MTQLRFDYPQFPNYDKTFSRLIWLGKGSSGGCCEHGNKISISKKYKNFHHRVSQMSAFQNILVNAARCFKWAGIFKIVKLRQRSLGIEKFLHVISKAGTYVSYDSHILHIYKYTCKGYVGHLQ